MSKVFIALVSYLYGRIRNYSFHFNSPQHLLRKSPPSQLTLYEEEYELMLLQFT